MKEVSVSFLKEGNYKEYIKNINNTNADYIHFDVMDGKFVSQVNLPLSELTKLISLSNKNNDIHLMVKNPIKYIDKLSIYNIYYLTIHREIDNFEECLERIISYGIMPGVAISPATEIENIIPYLDKIKLVLVMGVNPGKSGQIFIENIENKINKLKEYIDKNKLNVKIEVDGGVCDSVFDKIKNADIIVSASYVLDNFDNIEKLKNLE